MGKYRSRVNATVKQDRLLIDNMETPTNWSGSADVSNIQSSTTKLEGSSSLSFDKSGGTENFAHVLRNLASAEELNINEYFGGKFEFRINLSSIANVGNVSLILGEDGSNYSTYTITDVDLESGWNEVELDIDSPTSVTGTGADLSSVNFIMFRVGFDNNADTLTDILLDAFYVVGPTEGGESLETIAEAISENAMQTKVAPTTKARLASAASFLNATNTDNAKFVSARVTNGGTAQYIQVWSADANTDIAANGILKEVVYAAANASFEIGPVDPSEGYPRGIVVAGSSTALTYTAGANLGFTVVEYRT